VNSDHGGNDSLAVRNTNEEEIDEDEEMLMRVVLLLSEDEENDANDVKFVHLDKSGLARSCHPHHNHTATNL